MSISKYTSETDSYSTSRCVPSNTRTWLVSPDIYAVYMWRFPRTSSTYTDTSFQHVTITSFPHILIASSTRMYLQPFPQKDGIMQIQKKSSGKISWRLTSSKGFNQYRNQCTTLRYSYRDTEFTILANAIPAPAATKSTLREFNTASLLSALQLLPHIIKPNNRIELYTEHGGWRHMMCIRQTRSNSGWIQMILAEVRSSCI